MPTQEKIEAVAELKDLLSRATMVVSTGYRGMTVKEMQDLRRKLREGGIDVLVVKNTLLRLAAQDADRAGVMDVVDGPTALALTYGDIIDAAKAVTSYAQGAPAAFEVRGGFLDGAVLTAKDLADLTKIPPKPVLLAQFMGQMQSPLSGFIALLDGPLQELTLLFQSLLSELPGLVEARARQVESAS
jgi:large subunit ribosomal protein L10